MKTIPIFQVDAFTDQLFGGNPAAVCILDHWLDDELLQSIAMENNLAETAYIVPEGSGYLIRWFTPSEEVDLCGHATLASGYVVFNHLGYEGTEISFISPRSGELRVEREGDILYLDFPSDEFSSVAPPPGLTDGLGTEVVEIFKGKTDYLAVLRTEEEVQALSPDLFWLKGLKCRGIIVTAPGLKVDFVSRFFAPEIGIPEDPVTGSAHTTMIPYWSKRLNKEKMIARQLSARGGKLLCEDHGSRVKIGGKAKLFLSGEIYV